MNRGCSFQTLRHTGIHYALVQSLEGLDSQIPMLAGQRPPLLISFDQGTRASPAVDQQGPFLGQGWVPGAAPAPCRSKDLGDGAELTLLGRTSFVWLFWKGRFIFIGQKSAKHQRMRVLASTTRGFLRQNFRIALTQCIMVMIMITIITITTSSTMHPIYITYERSFNGLIEWKPFGIQWCCHQTIILVWLKMGYPVPVGTPKWMIYHDLPY